MADEKLQDQNDVSSKPKRYAWVAVLLALILSPFFSMLYLGKGRRGFAYLSLSFLAIVAPPFLASAGFWPTFVDMSFLGYAVRILGAVDAYRIAQRDQENFSGPWYSRWYGVSGAFLLVATFFVCIRAFIVEPFRIPSGAMTPTLLTGDYILASKFAYGIRLPIVNFEVFSANDPNRGEVMVYRYPENPSLIYLHRVVGLPGDRIEYANKRLSINGKLLDVERMDDLPLSDKSLSSVRGWRFRENLGTHSYSLLINPDELPVRLASVRQFPFRERCEYKYSSFICTVPDGHYFLMGDNRDSSSDSRYWGFVPDDHILGRAIMIWWNDDEPGRAGTAIQ